MRLVSLQVGKIKDYKKFKSAFLKQNFNNTNDKKKL